MASPPAEVGPARGDHQDDESERYRNARDVQYVAKSVVWRRRFWGRRLLGVCDEHQASGAISKTNLRRCLSNVNERPRIDAHV